jgi:hypothetical protein
MRIRLADGNGGESPTPQANLTIVMASVLAGVLAVVVVGMTAATVLAATLVAAGLTGRWLVPPVSGRYVSLADQE